MGTTKGTEYTELWLVFLGGVRQIALGNAAAWKDGFPYLRWDGPIFFWLRMKRKRFNRQDR